MSGERAWASLEAELERWRAARRVLTLWWRDDDACDDGPALRRLLALTAARAIPVALAVIPARVSSRLLARLDDCAPGQVHVLMHGITHCNRAPAGVRSSEFPPGCSVPAELARIDAARRGLRTACGARFAAVFVPPWNRIDPGLAARLEEAGFPVVSGFRGGGGVTTAGCRLDTHVDIVDWRGGRGFVGLEASLAAFTGQLRERRRQRRGADEPTGLLTHHAVLDEAGWRFLEALSERLAGSPAVRWTGVGVARGGRAGGG